MFEGLWTRCIIFLGCGLARVLEETSFSMPPTMLHHVREMGAIVGYLYTHNIGLCCFLEDGGV